MVHFGEGIVKVVEQGFPVLVLGGLSETFGVVLQFLPLHEQDVPVFDFDAPLQVVGDVARHGGDDGLGLGERGFEVVLLSGDYVECGYF